VADQFTELNAEHIRFIEAQKIFFTGTAASEGRVNVSPKGQDSMRIVSNRRLVWLNLTGSGNETAAHLLDRNRLTLMWCAFEGPPRILRVYGKASAIHPRDPAWAECADLLPPGVGARQYFDVDIDLVQTSCGYAVPNFEYRSDREALSRWSEKHGEQGIRQYWQDKNTHSLDGAPTGILE
jgi:hypothetical protein